MMKFLKRLLPLLVVLAAVLPSRAGNVPREKAAAAAQAFFAPQARRASNSSGGLSKGVSALTQAEYGSASLAAFNREGGGFVVISLNDALPPVLAWSPDGRFPSRDEMPGNMAWWFSSLEAQIESLGPEADGGVAVRQMWENVSASAAVRGGGKLYETAIWKQSTPFNNACPVSGTARCLTGCVATAGAIIARYFNWPDAGVGTVPAKDAATAGPDYPAHELGHSYQWDNMPLSYDAGYDASQAAAVATLMYDMGTIARMSYGPRASSASDGALLTGLKQYMKYNKGACLVNRADYDDARWSRMMKDNLDNCGPTIYTGRDPINGGHTFVLDGYDADGRFHFNWGWGSFFNCYCELNNLVAGSSGYVFSDSQGMIVDLVPDYEGTSTACDRIGFTAGGDYAGLRADTDSFERNRFFTCYAGWIVPQAADFNGVFYFALYDKAGNFKEDISYRAFNAGIKLGSRTAFSTSCQIKGPIEPGDRIRLRYVGQYNEGVVDVGAGCVTEIIVMEDSGGDEPDPAAGYTAAQTAASTSLHYDRDGKVLTLTFSHPVNWSVKNSRAEVLASGSALEGGSISIDFSGYASGIYTISAGSSEDPFSFTVTR